MRRYLPPVVATVVLTATFSSVAPAAASSDDDGASIQAWNEFAVTALIAPPNPVPGPAGPLYLTYLHRAVYDAVQDLPAARPYRRQWLPRPAGCSPTTSRPERRTSRRSTSRPW